MLKDHSQSENHSEGKQVEFAFANKTNLKEKKQMTHVMNGTGPWLLLSFSGVLQCVSLVLVSADLLGGCLTLSNNKTSRLKDFQA